MKDTVVTLTKSDIIFRIVERLVGRLGSQHLRRDRRLGILIFWEHMRNSLCHAMSP